MRTAAIKCQWCGAKKKFEAAMCLNCGRFGNPPNLLPHTEKRND